MGAGAAKKDKEIKILYIEDDELSLLSVVRYLNKFFYAQGVKTAEEALEITKNELYNILLVDIGLGQDTNGIEVVNKIKTYENYNNAITVAITSFAGTTDEEYIFSQGFNYFIRKPYMFEDLMDILNKAIIHIKEDK